MVFFGILKFTPPFFNCDIRRVEPLLLDRSELPDGFGLITVKEYMFHCVSPFSTKLISFIKFYPFSSQDLVHWNPFVTHSPYKMLNLLFNVHIPDTFP